MSDIISVLCSCNNPHIFFYFQFQSLLFIGLTITGILSYNCVINVNGTFNYASVVPTIFMALYFKSTCTPDAFPAYQSEFIKTKTILDPTDILIWDCVYLGVAVCWLIASGLILMCKYSNFEREEFQRDFSSI